MGPPLGVVACKRKVLLSNTLSGGAQPQLVAHLSDSSGAGLVEGGLPGGGGGILPRGIPLLGRVYSATPNFVMYSPLWGGGWGGCIGSGTHPLNPPCNLEPDQESDRI